MQSLRKWKIELLYNPAIPLLGKYPDKIIIQKDTRTPNSSTIYSCQDMETA